MKKKLILTMLASMTVLILCSTLSVASGNDDAMKMLRVKVAKDFSTVKSINRVAVMDLVNDDGSVRRAIETALQSTGTLSVIEREYFDTILKEQGLQFRDIIDEKTRVQHGKIKGVQGLVIGKVEKSETGILSYKIHLHLKLVDVESGEVLLTRDHIVISVSPWRGRMFWGAIGIMVMLSVLLLLYVSRTRNKRKTMQAEEMNKKDLMSKIILISSNLSAVRETLAEKGQAKEVRAIRENESEITLLGHKIAACPHGNHPQQTNSPVYDRHLRICLEDALTASNQMKASVAGGAKEVSQFMEKFKQASRDASDRLRVRSL
ncbi:MAG: CsgG/HfaB family protein [Syntrophales bacterium]|jgi:hypothetical protein